ncbi:hypothetical protein LNKW23_22380 [Paralimibaculum aggregatum]|uniref:PAP2 superfamily protein n=1 Tax=Paralimibaculum aggregatum TaxID=3036245 RepID=A0ABQ6LIB5_9RHOB|nr:vanadium-dependent haloperoxidase [Limibaculum sp. NKW23]GMG83025.1 hypothetical protein LNKW23_22380 [Limibaculum sp. NKW23]
MEDDIALVLDPETARVTVDDPSPTVSVIWDQAVQSAVIETAVGPTIASRAYALTHTAIFDAWASYDPVAVGVSVGDTLQQAAVDNTEANKTEAMSFAAYAVLRELFPEQGEIFDAAMAELGFPVNLGLVAPDSPASLGLLVAETLMAERRGDGSNQENGYADTSGYAPVNLSSEAIVDITRWTPENVPIDPEDDSPDQVFLTAHWGGVTPFALDDAAAMRPEPPAGFFVEGVDATLDIETATITFNGPEAPAPVAVSPELVGSVINPEFIAQAERLVTASAALTDEQKLIAEFWEDGGGTSFPPGTWMTFGEFVSASHDNTLDEDAVLFLALGNAVFDAGIATWESKVFYDYTRPVRAIRELGALGLIGEAGTDELTGEDGFVIEAWAGVDEGTRTILAENFIPYQKPGADPSPPFAEYTSGHSAFSAAAAQVLKSFAGSDDFGGSVTFEAGGSLFEPGTTPAEAVTLAWDTFTAAADEAGISRIYGGIHFDDGDLNGRDLGREVGREVWSEALLFVTGGGGEVADAPEAPDDLLALGRLFDLSLARVLDLGGYNFWVDVFDSGASLDFISEAFVLSKEFALQFGAPGELSDADFLDRVFENVDLDTGGDLYADALAELEGGASRGSVLADLAEETAVAEETLYLNNLTEVEEGVWAFA